MTVRIYAAPWKHPLECEVCGGSQQVKVSKVVPIGVHSRGLRWLPTRLAVVIACPQCTGADELVAHLPGGAS